MVKLFKSFTITTGSITLKYFSANKDSSGNNKEISASYLNTTDITAFIGFNAESGASSATFENLAAIGDKGVFWTEAGVATDASKLGTDSSITISGSAETGYYRVRLVENKGGETKNFDVIFHISNPVPIGTVKLYGQTNGTVSTTVLSDGTAATEGALTVDGKQVLYTGNAVLDSKGIAVVGYNAAGTKKSSEKITSLEIQDSSNNVISAKKTGITFNSSTECIEVSAEAKDDTYKITKVNDVGITSGSEPTFTITRNPKATSIKIHQFTTLSSGQLV